MTRRKTDDPIRYAKTSDVVDFVESLPDEYVMCRGPLRHPWEKARSIENEDLTWTVVVICPRCDSEKTYLYDKNFRLIKKPNASYEEDYLMQGKGRIVGDDRALLIKRWITGGMEGPCPGEEEEEEPCPEA